MEKISKIPNVSMSMCWDFIEHIKCVVKKLKKKRGDFKREGASSLRGRSLCEGESGLFFSTSLTEKKAEA